MATKEGGINRTLATFVHAITYADLPESVTEIAKNRILDALSAAYCGYDLPHSRTAIEIVRKNPGDSTIWGFDVKTALPDAIMANAVLAHSILQEDASPPTMVHPSTMIIPVALSVGEHERVSGKETVVAIVLGYELAGRIAVSARPMAMGAFRGGPIMGTFGAAATAGRLMKLGVDKLAHALGYAATLSPGIPRECWWGGTMDSVFEAGVAARIGLLSAELAEGGATAAPFALEGKHGFLRCWAGKTDGAHFLTDGLGKAFVISQTLIKPYPACALNQLPIQTAQPLAKHGLKATDIARVVERTWPGVTAGAGSDFAGPFMNQFQAQMSTQFCVAAAILGRPVESLLFYTEHYDDPEVEELAKRVELMLEEGRTKYRVDVYTHDGRVLTAEEEVVNQEPLTPSTAKMEKKLMALASDRIGENRVRQIIDTVKNLDKVEDICELTTLL